jgi:hypothetical protein
VAAKNLKKPVTSGFLFGNLATDDGNPKIQASFLKMNASPSDICFSRGIKQHAHTLAYDAGRGFRDKHYLFGSNAAIRQIEYAISHPL